MCTFLICNFILCGVQRWQNSHRCIHTNINIHTPIPVYNCTPHTPLNKYDSWKPYRYICTPVCLYTCTPVQVLFQGPLQGYPDPLTWLPDCKARRRLLVTTVMSLGLLYRSSVWWKTNKSLLCYEESFLLNFLVDIFDIEIYPWLIVSLACVSALSPRHFSLKSQSSYLSGAT